MKDFNIDKAGGSLGQWGGGSGIQVEKREEALSPTRKKKKKKKRKKTKKKRKVGWRLEGD